MVAGDRGGNGEGGRDGRAQGNRLYECEGDLADAQRQRSNNQPDKERAEYARAAVKRGHTGGEADEEG